MLSLRSQTEWRIIWKTSNLFGGLLKRKCLFTFPTLACSRRYSASGTAVRIPLSRGISGGATANENASQRSTSPNGATYPSEINTGTHPAYTASATRGLATSYPLGQRQNLDRRIIP
ncbi:unnamed protein product [Spirodela intermedia]|uniref:Uncharacterized protein n=1 Tax=Spirodela intermedia TaxID=51605 RepID=A0A7I8KXJ0_SPIIN|nr:unnamed protein product [Spirodela intermedia]